MSPPVDARLGFRWDIKSKTDGSVSHQLAFNRSVLKRGWGGWGGNRLSHSRGALKIVCWLFLWSRQQQLVTHFVCVSACVTAGRGGGVGLGGRRGGARERRDINTQRHWPISRRCSFTRWLCNVSFLFICFFSYNFSNSKLFYWIWNVNPVMRDAGFPIVYFLLVQVFKPGKVFWLIPLN